jgi:hypothetical protein
MKRILRNIVRAGLPMLAVFGIEVFSMWIFPVYALWPSFDIPMHVLGGFVTAWSGWLWWKEMKGNGAVVKPQWLIFFGLVGWAAFASIVWEMYEFLHDVLYPFAARFQPSIPDVMADLALDLFGAVAFCLIVGWKKNKR